VDLPQGPHRRYNPLLDEWVLCSPQRLQRPWQGRIEATAEKPLPPYDPDCYLCPGNRRANGMANPQYTTTFVFENDFPALITCGDGAGAEEGLLVARGERGVCRVICFTPRHDLSLARMNTDEIRKVLDTWAEEVRSLESRDDVGYVQLFENKGELMGCSNPHPHCQVWATEHVPTIPVKKLAAQRRFHLAHGRDLLGDYVETELRERQRVVLDNESWVVVVPFWAVWPFETLLLPRRRVEDLEALTDAERDALADAIRRLNVRYDNLFGTPFPYSMGWHGRPADGSGHPYVRLHASYFPPLLRSATVRKFLVGFEMTAEPQRDLTPEQAAERLREMPEVHYLDSGKDAAAGPPAPAAAR
jgi:UDPglucose--hexose-1-phosphate uridylyltransferase